VRKLGKTRLRIGDVGPADNGVYSCSARNVAGSVDSDDNFVLNVYGTKQHHSFILVLCTFVSSGQHKGQLKRFTLTMLSKIHF